MADNRFKKGNSGNPKGRPKMNKISYQFSNSVPTPTEGGKKQSLIGSNEDYIPFGSDNLFPQAVAAMSRKAVNHRAILTNKTIFVSGEEVTTQDSRTEAYIAEVNNKDENLKDVLDKSFRDYNEGGNVYIEVVKDGKALNLFHKDWTIARLRKDGKAVFFHPNWANVRQEKDKLVEIPIYPEFAQVEGKQRSVIHIKSYEPQFNFYGVPNWIAGMNASAIAYKTNKWNVSRLENSFALSGVLLVEGDMSEDDAAQLQADVNDQFAGEPGKIMTIVKALGGGGTSFTPVANTSEGDWLALHKQSTDDLVMAHNWYRGLSGIADNTGFDTQRIRNEYEIAHSTIIPSIRSKVLRKIKKVLIDQLNIGQDLTIKSLPPLKLLDKIDINSITRVWEGRKMAGLEADEEDPQQQEFIVNVKRNGTANNGTGGN